ncbi:MAG: Wadjet anti-phage system protein JetD domain-containing protein [Planctomycetaceae bacterium]
MITPDAIIAKASRIYPKAVAAWLHGNQDDFFPYRVPVNLTLAKDLAAAVVEVEQLRQASKEERGYGYTIEFESRRSRTHGLNRFPIAIWIDTLHDLVRLTGKNQEWESLRVAADLLRTRRPELSRWLIAPSNWRKLLDVADDLPGLLDIVDYLVAHPRPNCFARELPIAVSTKLLQANRRRLASWLDIVLPSAAIDHRYGYEDFEPRYGLRYARPHFLLRVLDDDLRAELGLPFDELSLPAESLSKLPASQVRILIVENKVNLLSLPAIERTIALGGLGNGVIQLGDIRWMYENPIYYWGDLDAEGFQILGRLRQVLGHVQSVLMTSVTLNAFQNLATPGNPAIATSATAIEHLTAEELECYESLCSSRQRIEQEHLPVDALLDALVASKGASRGA